MSPFIYVCLNICIHTHTHEVLFGERDWKISVSDLNSNQWGILKRVIIVFVPFKLITRTLIEGILPFVLHKKNGIFKKVFLKLQVRRNHSNQTLCPVHQCYNLHFLLDFMEKNLLFLCNSSFTVDYHCSIAILGRQLLLRAILCSRNGLTPVDGSDVPSQVVNSVCLKSCFYSSKHESAPV